MEDSRQGTLVKSGDNKHLAVSAKALWKSYALGETQVVALRGLDLELRQGEFTALVGPSGSGKSTLLNILGALDKPDAGSLSIAGQDVLAMESLALSKLRNRHTGFIFQAFHLIPVLTVEENVALPLQLFHEMTTLEKKERVYDMLKAVGLETLAKQVPSKLSGGQRQRVAIARALVTDPSLVLADEPTANLDSKTAHGIIDIMVELNQKKKACFLLSSHDEKLLTRVRRVVTMADGCLS